ncbi:MAG: dTDP-4-dehydrorhamnose 3,5-epimerase [Cyanobacteria bacterium P01_G01_bin.49]
MGLIKGVSLQKLESIQGGMAQFYTPQSSDETMLVQVPSGTIDELFVHRFQTDQILVVRGSFILVALHNKEYQYIPLSEDEPQVVTIPPGVPHGAINLGSKDCLMVNAVLRHGESHPLDYRPMKPPFPYDFSKVNCLVEDLSQLNYESKKEAALIQ